MPDDSILKKIWQSTEFLEALKQYGHNKPATPGERKIDV